MEKVKVIPKKTTAKGFVGTWVDGTVGWAMPKHLARGWNGRPEKEHWNAGGEIYLCEIKVTPLKDKRGRFIKRYIGGKPTND